MREWQTKPVGEAFRVVNGGTPKTGVSDYWDGHHQWITPAEMGGLSSPYLFQSRRRLTDEGLRVGAELVPAHSIILSTRAPIGHLVINEVPMAFNQGCKGLAPLTGIDTKFAYYFLLANVPLLESLGTGATFKELSGGKLKEVLFRFPLLPEQRRIVAILDQAFKGIATAKANTDRCLRNAQSLARSRIDSVFTNSSQTWPESPLASVADFVNGYAFKSTDFCVMSGVRSIKITNVGVGQFVAGEDNRLPAHFAQTHAASISKAGSIVLALTRTIIAGGVKVAVVPQAYDGALVNQRVAAIAPREQMLLTPFLFLFLSSQRVAQYVKDRVNTLMQPNLSITDLRTLQVPIPALSEQRVLMHQLAEFQCEARRLEHVYARKLAALDELKKSLLHRAFTGAL